MDNASNNMSKPEESCLLTEAIKLAPRARSSSAVTSAAIKRKSTSLPNETVEYLKAWMMSPAHIAHPYPSELEKAKIMEETGIELKQLTNWFVNNRKRYWKPRVEARLRDQQKKSPPTSLDTKSSESKSLLDLQSPKIAALAEAATRTPSKRRSPVTASVSPIAAMVSEQNSVASDNVQSSDDDEDMQDAMHSETIEIHILRPSSDVSTPTLSDVSVLQNIPRERILQTFHNCALTFAKNRDSEIVRMKKHYLSVYMSSNKRKAPAESTPAMVTPRQKYRRMSVDLWKEACQSANHVYDHQLPSLEEAARLFGYAT